MLRNTIMRNAFSAIRVSASAMTEQGAIIADHIFAGMRTKAGVVNERDVNINVSDKTFKQLKRDGMLPANMLGA